MILGKGSSTQSIVNEFENIDFNISTEACGYTSIISDATEEIAALESALYVADIMLEEKVLEGATPEEMEVLLEGVVSSVYGRLKEVLKKLLAKVKQWFANVKKFFQVLFSHGKDFAKKYKTDIIKAAARANGYKYKTYDFAGGWGSLLDMVSLGKMSASLSGAVPLAAADKVIGSKPNEKSTTELTKAVMKDTWGSNYDSQAEFNKEFREKLYGGTEKEEFEDFNKGPSVQDMLTILEQGAKVITNLDKSEKAIRTQCDRTIKDLEKTENEVAKSVKSGETYDSKRYTVATEICKAGANCLISVADIYKEAIKVAMRDAESILKGLLRHKPVKEGFEGAYLEDGNDSVLESALKLI